MNTAQKASLKIVKKTTIKTLNVINYNSMLYTLCVEEDGAISLLTLKFGCEVFKVLT